MNTRLTGPVPEADDPGLAHARKLALTVYVLHALSWVMFVTYFVAIIINYGQRGRVAGTIYESHFDWQIRTFWVTLICSTIGVAVLITGLVNLLGSNHGGAGLIILGSLVLFFDVCWHLYRVIRGLMHWSDRRPI